MGLDQNDFQTLNKHLTRPIAAECLSLHGAGWWYVSRVRMVCTTGLF